MNDTTVLLFALNEDRLSIPVARVREILDTGPIKSLPQAPDYVLGHIDLRGESILAVDFRLLVGKPPREDDQDTRLIVIWVESEDGQIVLALRVDRVCEVASLDDGLLTSFKTGNLLNWDSRIVRGVGHFGGQSVTVLCPDMLFRNEVLADLHAPEAGQDEECPA